MIDLSIELAAALKCQAVTETLKKLIAEAVRAEVRAVIVEPDRLVDADEAAMLLSMTPSAVRKAATRGQLPCVRVGRRLRFRVRAILDWAGARSPRQRHG